MSETDSGLDPSGLHGSPAQREQVRKRIERKRKLYGDFLAYIGINAFLVVVWAINGAGAFWPGWVLGGWGVLLLLDAWDVYYRKPLTDADIDRELAKRR